MNLPEYATYAIALAVTAGVVWICYPHFLLVLGINQYRNGVFGGPEDLDPDDKSERFQKTYNDLIQLGFEPLGLHWSTIGRTISTQAYVFALSEVPCIAEIYSRSDNLYLVTGFEGNSALETTSVPTKEVRSKDFCLTSLPHASVQVLLADHRNQVEELVAQGWRPLPASRLEEIPAITRAASSGSNHNSRLRGFALKHLQTILTSVGIAALTFGWIFGFAGPWPWLGAALAAAAFHSMSQSSSTRVRLDKNAIQSSQPQSVDSSSE
jgi:hypothetical protein